MLKKTILAILSVYLCSCVVLHEEYFLPKADGAIIEKESCRGKVGADNQLLYKFDNVEVKLNVWEFKEITRLGISIRVFGNGNIVWPSQLVELNVDNKKQELKADSFTRLRFKNRYQSNELLEKEYSINSVMDRTTEEESEVYSMSFIVAEKEINMLNISKIKVIVNDKERILSDMLFTKTSGVFLHPLNC